MEDLAEHVALVHWLAREVQGSVPIADQRWQENDAQLHLEIASALATRAEDFGPTM